MKKTAPYIPESKGLCFSVLDTMLTKKEREMICKSDPVDLHFNLGLWIRNNWIYKTNVWHFFAEDAFLADNLSQQIIAEYVDYLKTGEIHDEPECECRIYRAEGYYHIIDAHITHGWLYIGESEDVYGSDRDEEYSDIPWQMIATAMGVDSKQELLKALQVQGKDAIRYVKKILEEKTIPHTYHLH